MHRMAHTPTPYVTDPNTCVSVLLGPCQPHAWTFAHVCCACSFMQVARKSIAFADHQNYFDCCTVLMGGTKAIFLKIHYFHGLKKFHTISEGPKFFD